jgi:hypothetical protein
MLLSLVIASDRWERGNVRAMRAVQTEIASLTFAVTTWAGCLATNALLSESRLTAPSNWTKLAERQSAWVAVRPVEEISDEV